MARMLLNVLEISGILDDLVVFKKYLKLCEVWQGLIFQYQHGEEWASQEGGRKLYNLNLHNF